MTLRESLELPHCYGSGADVARSASTHTAVRRGRLREALAATFSARVPFIVIALVLASVVVACNLTAGQAAASERKLAESVDSAGTRVVMMADGNGTAGLSAPAVERVAQISTVQWALGLGLFSPVHNARIPGTNPVSARSIVGGPVPDITIVSGRWPEPGEAAVSRAGAAQLGLTAVAGSVVDDVGTTSTVVGVFEATGVLDKLGAEVIIAAQPSEDVPLPQLVAVARTAGEVPQLTANLADISGASSPSALRISGAQALTDIAEAASGQLGEFSRQLALLVLVVGLTLVALTMVSAVASRRRDHGRLRALGATRTDIVLLVCVQALAPALVGSVIGTGAA